MESREVVPAIHVDCPLLEPLRGSSALFTDILPRHVADIQLCLRHLRGDHNLWYCVLVGDARGRMVEDKADCSCDRSNELKNSGDQIRRHEYLNFYFISFSHSFSSYLNSHIV